MVFPDAENPRVRHIVEIFTIDASGMNPAIYDVNYRCGGVTGSRLVNGSFDGTPDGVGRDTANEKRKGLSGPHLSFPYPRLCSAYRAQHIDTAVSGPIVLANLTKFMNRSAGEIRQ